MDIQLKNKALTIHELRDMLAKEFGDDRDSYDIELDEGVETLTMMPWLIYEITIKIKNGVIYLESTISIMAIFISVLLGFCGIVPGVLMFIFLIWFSGRISKFRKVKEFVMKLGEI